MTATDASEAHPAALEETEAREGRGRITGTGRMITTTRTGDQMERFGKETLVEPDDGQGQPSRPGRTWLAHADGPDFAAVMRTAAAA